VKKFGLIGVLCVVIAACSGNPDTSENVLPDWQAVEGGDANIPLDADHSDGSGGGEWVFPATYRFTEIVIEQLGSQGPTDILTQILSIQWKSDIDDFMLSVLFRIDELNVEDGSIVLEVNSGVGADNGSLCVKSESKNGAVSGVYDEGSFTYFFELVNIYTEDDDGTHFNCSLDAERPNGIPLRDCDGTGDLSADGTTVVGKLIGCMSKYDVDTTCTCLGKCDPEQVNEECGDCPAGAGPLNQKLGDIQTTDICTERLGQPAYDLHVSFVAKRIEFTPGDCE
jgi:hypothetical protein